MAQNTSFHGVSMSGTTTPIIANSPDNQPLLGLIYLRLDSNGVNSIHHDVDYARIITGKLLQPGGDTRPEAGSYSMRGNFKVRVRRVDSVGNVTMAVEGDTLGYKILAVLFADGTFYSRATAADVQGFHQDGSPMKDSEVQDKLFQRLSTDISTVRGIGQSLQGTTAEERSLALSRMSLLAPVTPGVSRDPLAEGHRKQMAIMLTQLADEDTRTAALERLAALPDVVKGE